MNRFCVEKIAMDGRLRPAHGILPARALTVVSDARALAERIVREAREEAQAIAERAQAEAETLKQAAEAGVLERAAAMLACLEQAQAAVAERAADTVIELVLGLFDRLLVRLPAHKRIEASLRRLRLEAPVRLAEAVLYVHPEDAGLLSGLEWEVRHDAALARGACRLEAACGEWHADFEAAVASVRQAFCDAAGYSDRGGVAGPARDESAG